MWSSAKGETLPLLRETRRDGRDDGHARFADLGSSDARGGSSARAWTIAGVTAAVGTFAVVGISATSSGSAGLSPLGAAAAATGIADALPWTARGVSSPAPRLGSDKWAQFVSAGPNDDADPDNDVALTGQGLDREPREMLQEWDEYVKWDPKLHEQQKATPGLYDPVDPTIPMLTDVDRVASALTWNEARSKGYVMNPDSFKETLMRDPTGFLVIHAVNGLGNRIRALAAAKCLSMQRNRKLIVVWERDDSLDAPVDSIFTPSFLRGSFILEQLPYNFMTQEHDKLTKWNKGEGNEEHKPVFSLIHDATTEWGKRQVSAEVAEDNWINWKGAVYIKSSHAELQLSAAEYNFVSSYMIYFQPSSKVSTVMKSIPLATKSDDQVVSMHIRAGQDAKLSSDLKLEGEAQEEVALIDSYRQQCSVDSFVNVLTQRAPDAVTRGIDIFVAADSPEDVADLRARLPNNKVYALDRPAYCNYGYNKAREEECMIYAVADLFLLSRNPGPMLRSKFSSFSDFANYYRKRAGRLQGKGFLVNGCADDGNLQEGVLTSAAAASLGAERVYAGEVLQKSVVSDAVVTRFDMTVLGGAPRADLGESAKTLCDSIASVAGAASLCAPSRLAACADRSDVTACEREARAFYGEVRDVFDGGESASLGAKATRDAPFVIELNPLMRSEGAGAGPTYPAVRSGDAATSLATFDSGASAFPEVKSMAALAESEGVDFTVAALYRDPVEATARAASLSTAKKGEMFRGVLDAFAGQTRGYREMATQLRGISRDFYKCHSMDDAPPLTKTKSARREREAKKTHPALGNGGDGAEATDLETASAAVGRWAWGGWNKKTGAATSERSSHPSRSLLGLGASEKKEDAAETETRTRTRAKSPIEPAVLAAYDALGADAFYWFSAFSREMRSKTAEDGFYAALSVAMPDRLDLLERVQKDAGRPLNRVEMLEYVQAENAAYAAYFAFRTGVCR